jgi:hypothetical protein
MSRNHDRIHKCLRYSEMYYNIYKLVVAYCSECVSDNYYKLMVDLEGLFDDFIKESEQ